jgi:hypothetical protein
MDFLTDCDPRSWPSQLLGVELCLSSTNASAKDSYRGRPTACGLLHNVWN